MSFEMSRRELKAADEGAGRIAKAMTEVAGLAQKAALQYVMDGLRKNTVLMYTISGLMKNKALVALLDGTLSTGDDVTASSQQNTARGRFLRANWKYFESLKQKPAFVEKCLRCLEPDLFAEESFHETYASVDKLSVLCCALRVSRGALLPTQCFEGLEEEEAFIEACRQRYTQAGQPFKDKTADDVMIGYFRKLDGNRIECCMDKAETKTIVDLSAANSIVINDTLNAYTSVDVDYGSMSMVMERLVDVFTKAGMPVSDLDTQWELANATPKVAQPKTTPKKRQRGPRSAGEDLSACPLNEALSDRLSKKQRV